MLVFFLFWIGGGGTGAGLLTVFWLCFFLFIVLHVIVDFPGLFFLQDLFAMQF